ncbi:MAG: DHHA1 domain-containing protein, partial [Thermoplasmata archaeon]
PVQIAGNIGDKEHRGGLKGLNLTNAEKGIEKGLVKIEQGLKTGSYTIEDFLEHSPEPFFIGLTGNRQEIGRILRILKIPADKRSSEVSKEELKLLNSFLVIRLLRQRCAPELIEEFLSDKYVIINPAYPTDNLDELQSVADACGRMKMPETGIEIMLGSREAFKEGKVALNNFYSRILSEIIKLTEGIRLPEKDALQLTPDVINEDRLKNLKDLNNIENSTLQEDKLYHLSRISFFITAEHVITGGVAGIISSYVNGLYLEGSIRPVFGLAFVDTNCKISSRTTKVAVSKGIHLGQICREAALLCGGQGGGHPVAAGATIPAEKTSEFLIHANRMAQECLRKKEV